MGIFLDNFLQMHENPQYDDNSLTKRKKKIGLNPLVDGQDLSIGPLTV